LQRRKKGAGQWKRDPTRTEKSLVSLVNKIRGGKGGKGTQVDHNFALPTGGLRPGL